MLYNIICASCGCIGHNRSDYNLVSVLDQRLSCLKVEPRTLVLYDFSCGIAGLDEQNIMIDPLGIQQDDSSVWLCSTCHPSIMLGKRPPESLANFRWVGPVPDELKDLTWIEELLIAHAHVVSRVVGLQARNQASYFGIKGHMILLPQDYSPPRRSSDVACLAARRGPRRMDRKIGPRPRPTLPAIHSSQGRCL